MDMLEAIDIIEGITPASDDQVLAAWQSLIDSGVVWQLQGSYGRMAKHLIEEGVCNAYA